jgi:hypothetical protein
MAQMFSWRAARVSTTIDLDAPHSVDVAGYQGEDRVAVGQVLGRIEGAWRCYGRD